MKNMKNKNLVKIILSVKAKYLGCKNKEINKFVGRKLAGDIK